MARFNGRVAKGDCLHCLMMELLDDWRVAQQGAFAIDGEPCSAGDRVFNDTLCVVADIVAAQETRKNRRVLIKLAADQLPRLVADTLRRRQDLQDRKVGFGSAGHA